MKLPNMDFDADINFLLCESDFTTPNSYSSSSSTSSSSIYDEYSKARVVLSTEQRLKQARIVLEYQQLSDHYDICGSRLQQLTKEIESLRRQNDHLRLTNAALLNLLAVPDTDHEKGEVYNQGTRKTELCNKWEETGTCPYGQNCQFAHGISELRPVIRHPKYKTQVCRMILHGEVCPYGHRCHFRHSLPRHDLL